MKAGRNEVAESWYYKTPLQMRVSWTIRSEVVRISRFGVGRELALGSEIISSAGPYFLLPSLKVWQMRHCSFGGWVCFKGARLPGAWHSPQAAFVVLFLWRSSAGMNGGFLFTERKKSMSSIAAAKTRNEIFFPMGNPFRMHNYSGQNIIRRLRRFHRLKRTRFIF